MEKTMKYAINEAIDSGRRSAMPEFLEAELSEKIAQEIEQKRKPYGKLAWEKDGEERQFYLGICEGMNFSIAIVRGNNDSN